MAEFISTFITGFQDIVSTNLPMQLKGCKILGIYDGLVHYTYAGNSRDLEKIIYFNNTFFLLKIMKGKNLSFPALVGALSSEKKYYLINKGTFRVRFSQENQFAKVDKALVRKAETIVMNNSKLKIDRLSPETEIWYSIRSEGFAYCGQLISKREFTEKNLNKGELRPEIAYLICAFAGVAQEKELVIADPFCGYASIPVQLAKRFRFKKLFVSDIDNEKIQMVSEKKALAGKENIEVFLQDALSLERFEDKSLDLIITDPPWGYYEDIGDISAFYNKMFSSFKRVLKEEGKLVILSARKEELEKEASCSGFKEAKSLHTLVNGKKASLYLYKYKGI
ncbi:MAG: methyltransferase domain-containing protein [Treponema sp.]|nr:methyltransferase domain-containing protein [Treponema sp.]